MDAMQPRTRFTLWYYLWVLGLILLMDSLYFSAPSVPEIDSLQTESQTPKRHDSQDWSLCWVIGVPVFQRIATLDLEPPPARGNGGPDALHHTKWPGPLKEAVDRAERAGRGEPEDEPRTAILQRVEHQHQGHCNQTEEGERIHRTDIHYDASLVNACR
jgi:hypothetical protein